jgi:hypothetical protein
MTPRKQDEVAREAVHALTCPQSNKSERGSQGATDREMTTPVSIDAKAEPLKTSLQRLLKSVGLTYTVKDGLLTITSESSNALDEEPPAKDAPKEKGGTPD